MYISSQQYPLIIATRSPYLQLVLQNDRKAPLTKRQALPLEKTWFLKRFLAALQQKTINLYIKRQEQKVENVAISPTPKYVTDTLLPALFNLTFQK